MPGELDQSEIDALIARFPLPDGVGDCVLNREELAEAMGVTLPTVSDWIRRGMPVREAGGQGKPYELSLAACWAWRQAVKADEETASARRRQHIQNLRLTLVGGERGDSIEALHPRERKEILLAQMAQEQFERERNRLLKREDVADMLDVLFSLFRDRINARADLIERLFAPEPKVVGAIIDQDQQLIVDMRGAIDRFLADRPVQAGSHDRTDLFDA